MTRLSYTQVASEFQLVNLELIKESKGYSCNGTKFTNLQSAREWCLEQEMVTGWMGSYPVSPEQKTVTDYTSCLDNTCPATLPVLSEDEPITTPDCEFDVQEKYDFPLDFDADDFRQLLDNSLLNDSGGTPKVSVTVAPYQDIRSDDWLSSTLQSIVRLIKKHSRGRCDHMVMGFDKMICQGQSYWEMTTRTPRRIYRRAKRFIGDILKASKGMPYAQYSR